MTASSPADRVVDAAEAAVRRGLPAEVVDTAAGFLQDAWIGTGRKEGRMEGIECSSSSTLRVFFVLFTSNVRSNKSHSSK